jgi:hypothetical protein
VWDKNFIDEMHPFFGLINELHSHLSEHIQSRLNPNEELIYDKKETRIIVYATSADKDEFGKRIKESIDKSTKRSDSILRLLDRGEKKLFAEKRNVVGPDRGSVCRIKPGAAKVELFRVARSTLTLGEFIGPLLQVAILSLSKRRNAETKR